MLLGTAFNVQHNYIADNGRPFTQFPAGAAPGTPWSDGMTVLGCEAGYIAHNVFVDNTDIDLVLGGGHGCVAELNTIAHFGKYGFAGLNVGRFDGGVHPGDHAGSYYQGNRIYTGTYAGGEPTPGSTAETVILDKLSMGILVGTHPWQSAYNVVDAGYVVGNTSHHNVMNLVVDGVSAGVVDFNTQFDALGSFGKGDCPLAGVSFAVNTLPSHVTLQQLQSGFAWVAYDDNRCFAIPH